MTSAIHCSQAMATELVHRGLKNNLMFIPVQCTVCINVIGNWFTETNEIIDFKNI